MPKPPQRPVWEPIPALVRLLEAALAERGAEVGRPCAPESLAALDASLHLPLSPSWRAFLERHDGATAGDVRFFSAREAMEARASAPEGLMPAGLDDDEDFYFDLDAADADGDWPVVTTLHGQPEPAGTTFLRHALALLAESPGSRAAIDPEHGDHWIELLHERDEAGDREGAWSAAQRGLLAAHPVGPALLVAVAEEAVRQGRLDDAAFHFDMALDAEVFSTRDEEARFDAAAERLALARAAQVEDEAARRCLDVLGDGACATASVWREEALQALGRGRAEWAAHAARVVLALAPEDADAPKLVEASPAVREAAELAWAAREIEGSPEREEEARRRLDRAQAKASLGVVLLQHARFATPSNPRQAAEIARRAVLANPALVEAHFQMGECYLLADDHAAAETVLRKVVERDPGYGLAWSKLALSVLNQQRATEALELCERAVGRSDDAFFTQSVLGDCLYELRRFDEATQAYEEALKHFGRDHWTLHQTANACVETGNYPRAAELYERAMEHNPDRCHQTLADYADLKRRMGRVGDAVRLYREAVKMAPDEPQYRDLLRETKKEVGEAPN